MILHGGPGVGDCRDQVRDYGALADEFRLLFYDARGSGRSEDMPPYTHEQWVADARRADASARHRALRAARPLATAASSRRSTRSSTRTGSRQLILVDTAPVDRRERGVDPPRARRRAARTSRRAGCASCSRAASTPTRRCTACGSRCSRCTSTARSTPVCRSRWPTTRSSTTRPTTTPSASTTPPTTCGTGCGEIQVPTLVHVRRQRLDHAVREVGGDRVEDPRQPARGIRPQRAHADVRGAREIPGRSYVAFLREAALMPGVETGEAHLARRPAAWPLTAACRPDRGSAPSSSTARTCRSALTRSSLGTWRGRSPHAWTRPSSSPRYCPGGLSSHHLGFPGTVDLPRRRVRRLRARLLDTYGRARRARRRDVQRARRQLRRARRACGRVHARRLRVITYADMGRYLEVMMAAAARPA